MRKEIEVIAPVEQRIPGDFTQEIKGTLVITVQERFKTLPKSQHPDFENMTPRQVVVFHASAEINGIPLKETREYDSEQQLLSQILGYEEYVKLASIELLKAKYKISLKEKMKTLGYV